MPGRGRGADSDQKKEQQPPPRRSKRQQQQQQRSRKRQKRQRFDDDGDIQDIDGAIISSSNARRNSGGNGIGRTNFTSKRGRSRPAAATRLEQQQLLSRQFLMDQLDTLMLVYLIERFYQQQEQRRVMFLPVLHRYHQDHQLPLKGRSSSQEQRQLYKDNDVDLSLQHVEQPQENECCSSRSAQQQQQTADDAVLCSAIPSLLTSSSSTPHQDKCQHEERSDGSPQRLHLISTLDDLIVYWLLLDWDNRQVVTTEQQNEQQEQPKPEID